MRHEPQHHLNCQPLSFISFNPTYLLLHSAFEERVRSSHHILRRDGVEERINLQKQRSKAKPYQVRQVRAVILRYRWGEISDV